MSESLNVSLTAWTMVVNAVGSAMLPGNTRNCDRAPGGVGQQPVLDLGQAFFPSRV